MPDALPAWRLANGRSLALDRSRILAIVNATPDSFSDGGRYRDAAHAADEALRMLSDGADAIDVGGESTRPGALAVPPGEQIRRIVPVIEALRAKGCEAPISVDTTRAEVARAALTAGADAVNDQSAGEDDPAMLGLLAAHGAGCILMHRLRRSDRDAWADAYGNSPPDYSARGGVVTAVGEYLASRVEAARSAGIAMACVVIDPGLGFGKTVAQNLALVDAASRLAAIGPPVLCAASRKRFIGVVTGVESPADRAAGSAAVAVAMRLGGVKLFRAHDIKTHRGALDMADALIATRSDTTGLVHGR